MNSIVHLHVLQCQQQWRQHKQWPQHRRLPVHLELRQPGACPPLHFQRQDLQQERWQVVHKHCLVILNACHLHIGERNGSDQCLSVCLSVCPVSICLFLSVCLCHRRNRLPYQGAERNTANVRLCPLFEGQYTLVLYVIIRPKSANCLVYSYWLR